MFKKSASLSAVSLAALALSACGGGGGGGSDTPKAVDFKWASLSQVIPVGKTALTITPTSCMDNADAAVTGVTLDIAANGDVSYRKDGAEVVLIAYATRSQGSLTINGTPGSADAYVEASGVTPIEIAPADAHNLQSAQNARIVQPTVSYSVGANSFVIRRSTDNLYVSCTLSASLTHNNSLPMQDLSASLIPSSNTHSTVESNGANGLYLSFTKGDPSSFKSGAAITNKNATALALTDNRLIRLSQNYNKVSQVLDGLTFTHWRTCASKVRSRKLS